MNKTWFLKILALYVIWPSFNKKELQAIRKVENYQEQKKIIETSFSGIKFFTRYDIVFDLTW